MSYSIPYVFIIKHINDGIVVFIGKKCYLTICIYFNSEHVRDTRMIQYVKLKNFEIVF